MIDTAVSITSIRNPITMQNQTAILGAIALRAGDQLQNKDRGIFQASLKTTSPTLLHPLLMAVAFWDLEPGQQKTLSTTPDYRRYSERYYPVQMHQIETPTSRVCCVSSRSPISLQVSDTTVLCWTRSGTYSTTRQIVSPTNVIQ